jgi:hypothetical protein
VANFVPHDTESYTWLTFQANEYTERQQYMHSPSRSNYAQDIAGA